MILEAFSLRDTKAEVFGAPFFVTNEEIAKRLLSKLVLDQRSDPGQYPKDFLMYRIGTYDSDNGLLVATPVELICTATSCLPKPDPRQHILPLGDLAEPTAPVDSLKRVA